MSTDIEFIKEQDEILTEKQAAEYLKFSQKALQKWRCHGNGPQFIKVSAKAIRYRKIDLVQWALDRIVTSTSQVLKSE